MPHWHDLRFELWANSAKDKDLAADKPSSIAKMTEEAEKNRCSFRRDFDMHVPSLDMQQNHDMQQPSNKCLFVAPRIGSDRFEPPPTAKAYFCTESDSGGKWEAATQNSNQDPSCLVSMPSRRLSRLRPACRSGDRAGA